MESENFMLSIMKEVPRYSHFVWYVRTGGENIRYLSGGTQITLNPRKEKGKEGGNSSVK